MQVHCENCGTAIPAANINIQEKLAVCPQCDTVFSFADHTTVKPRKTKPPQALKIVEKENTLEISFRWLKLLETEEHFFTLLMGSGAAATGGAAVALFDGLNTPVEAALGVLCTLAALVCLYMFLTMIVNRVRITIDDRWIRARHEPLPLTTPTIKRDSIIRILCEPAFYTNAKRDGDFADYDVKALCDDGKQVTLTTLRRDVAFYVADTIDSYLWKEEELDQADPESEEDDNLTEDSSESERSMRGRLSQ